MSSFTLPPRAPGPADASRYKSKAEALKALTHVIQDAEDALKFPEQVTPADVARVREIYQEALPWILDAQASAKKEEHEEAKPPGPPPPPPPPGPKERTYAEKSWDEARKVKRLADRAVAAHAAGDYLGELVAAREGIMATRESAKHAKAAADEQEGGGHRVAAGRTRAEATRAQDAANVWEREVEGLEPEAHTQGVSRIAGILRKRAGMMQGAGAGAAGAAASAAGAAAAGGGDDGGDDGGGPGPEPGPGDDEDDEDKDDEDKDDEDDGGGGGGDDEDEDEEDADAGEDEAIKRAEDEAQKDFDNANKNLRAGSDQSDQGTDDNTMGEPPPLDVPTYEKLKRVLYNLKVGLEARMVHGLRSGNVNMGRAMQFPKTGDIRIFEKRLPSRVGAAKIAVAIALDVSGSMVDNDKKHQAPKGALAVSAALFDLGHEVEIIGYGNTSTPVGAMKQRGRPAQIPVPVLQNSTSWESSLPFMAGFLFRARAPTRVALVFTDGDIRQRTVDQWAHIQALARQRIPTFYIQLDVNVDAATIASGAAGRHPNLAPWDAWYVIADMAQLPDMFKKLVASVAQQVAKKAVASR